jgi:hypothetical protein
VQNGSALLKKRLPRLPLVRIEGFEELNKNWYEDRGRIRGSSHLYFAQSTSATSPNVQMSCQVDSGVRHTDHYNLLGSRKAKIDYVEGASYFFQSKGFHQELVGAMARRIVSHVTTTSLSRSRLFASFLSRAETYSEDPTIALWRRFSAVGKSAGEYTRSASRAA